MFKTKNQRIQQAHKFRGNLAMVAPVVEVMANSTYFRDRYESQHRLYWEQWNEPKKVAQK